MPVHKDCIDSRTLNAAVPCELGWIPLGKNSWVMDAAQTKEVSIYEAIRDEL
jgi:hypothetical protein